MIATAILGVGVVLVYRAFFTSLDAFNYCSEYLVVCPWMDEKIVQAQEELSKYGRFVDNQTSGAFISKNRDFTWSLNGSLEDQTKKFDLYKVDLSVSWQEGVKKRRIWRQAYALYAKKE